MLQLLGRPGVKIEDDQYRGRHVVRIDYPPLTDGEVAGLTDALGILEHALLPGSRPSCVAMLARLANHRNKDRSPAEWQMIFEDYAAGLAEFSDAHVSEAITEHRRNSNFFPSIAELRERCMELRLRDKWRFDKARRLLERAA